MFHFQPLWQSTHSVLNPSPMVTMIVPVGMPSTRKTLKYIKLVPLMKMTSIQSTAIWRKHKLSGGCFCLVVTWVNESQLQIWLFPREVFHWNMTWLDVHHKSILNFEDLLVVPSSYNNQDAICLWIQRNQPDEHSKYLDKVSDAVITKQPRSSLYSYYVSNEVLICHFLQICISLICLICLSERKLFLTDPVWWSICLHQILWTQ